MIVVVIVRQLNTPGKNALQLLSRFPQKERQTLRTDYRRITFIAEMYENGKCNLLQSRYTQTYVTSKLREN